MTTTTTPARAQTMGEMIAAEYAAQNIFLRDNPICDDAGYGEE